MMHTGNTLQIIHLNYIAVNANRGFTRYWLSWYRGVYAAESNWLELPVKTKQYILY